VFPLVLDNLFLIAAVETHAERQEELFYDCNKGNRGGEHSCIGGERSAVQRGASWTRRM